MVSVIGNAFNGSQCDRQQEQHERDCDAQATRTHRCRFQAIASGAAEMRASGTNNIAKTSSGKRGTNAESTSQTSTPNTAMTAPNQLAAAARSTRSPIR